MKPAGIILIVIGLLMTVYTTVTFFSRDKVAKIGKLEITKEKPHTLIWSPIVGVVIMGVGGIMVWKGQNGDL